MTKAAELKILRDAATALGPDSYLGPALLSLLPMIEMDMRSDIIPDLPAMIRGMEDRLVGLNTSVKAAEFKLAELQKQHGEAERAADASASRLAAYRRGAGELAVALRDLADRG